MIRLTTMNERGRLVDEDSLASQQAKKMGLVYKGFGRWADPQSGKVTHKSDNGRLIPLKPERGGLPYNPNDPGAQFKKYTGTQDTGTVQGPGAGPDDQDFGDHPDMLKKMGFEPKGTDAYTSTWQHPTGYSVVHSPSGFTVSDPNGKRLKQFSDPDNPADAMKYLGSLTGTSAPKDPEDQRQKVKQLAQMLQKHDWTYDQSDDHTMWRRGKDAEKEIEDYIKSSGIDQKLAHQLWAKLAPADKKGNFPGQPTGTGDVDLEPGKKAPKSDPNQGDVFDQPKDDFDLGDPPEGGVDTRGDDESEDDFYNRQADQDAAASRGEKGLDMDPSGQEPASDELTTQYRDIQKKMQTIQDKVMDNPNAGENEVDRASKLLSQLRLQKQQIANKIKTADPGSGEDNQANFKAADAAGELPLDGPPGPDTMGDEPPVARRQRPKPDDNIPEPVDNDTRNAQQARLEKIVRIYKNAKEKGDDATAEKARQAAKFFRDKISNIDIDRNLGKN